jgi:hypothetical protein
MSDPSSDRGEDVIVTPEMVNAGCAELDGFVAKDIVDGFINPEEVVAKIYRAMFLLRPQGQ